MLNLPHITTDTAAAVCVPVLPDLPPLTDGEYEWAFSLRSIIDNRAVSLDMGLDVTLSANYARFKVIFNEDAPNGEYAYKVTASAAGVTYTVSEGLATVGDYVHQAKEHKETIQYKQYGQ